jgi:hypothetical protein
MREALASIPAPKKKRQKKTSPKISKRKEIPTFPQKPGRL